MSYSIGEVSKMFNIPVSTLRYYDSEGLFPNLERKSGIRVFSDHEVDTLHMIECLKKTGLEIREIRQFINWTKEGPSSYAKRKQLMEQQRDSVEEQIRAMQKNLAMIKFKCWYYEEALKDGNEDKIHEMLPDKLPENIQPLYDIAHDRIN